MQVAERVPFYDLAELCEKIYNCHDFKIKKLILGKFIFSWRKYHQIIHKKDNNTHDSFYPAMRLLLPDYERERVAYGVKETLLSHIFIRALSLAKDGQDAKHLLHYTDFEVQEKGHVIDFADIAYEVVKNRSPERGSLSIEEVNDGLDKIAINKATRNKDLVTNNILYFIRHLSALELKWLIRILLKKVSLGISHTGILKTFHPDAVALFDVSNDLEKICLTLVDPDIRLTHIDIDLFTPFKPMLAERSSHYSLLELINKDSDNLNKSKGNEGFIVETKFDGERMQIHFSRDVGFKYFSRRGFDYTASYGPSEHEGIFTPIIHKCCIGMDVNSFILDGEMVGYHKPTSTIGHKGEKFDIKYIYETSDYQICYAAFDLLYFNGQLLTSKPLRERKILLAKKFKPKPGVFFVVDYKVLHTEQEIMASLSHAIEARDEGLMIKDPFSVYKANVRNGGGWFKLKPDYVAGLTDSLDLLIVGGYYRKRTHGRSPRKRGRNVKNTKITSKKGVIDDDNDEQDSAVQGKVITHFVVAARVTSQNPDQPDRYLPICVVHIFTLLLNIAIPLKGTCKVGSGFSNQELYFLLSSLRDSFKPNPALSPHLASSKLSTTNFIDSPILWGLRGYRPDLIIDPNKSVVLQIKASEVMIRNRIVDDQLKNSLESFAESKADSSTTHRHSGRKKRITSTSSTRSRKSEEKELFNDTFNSLPLEDSINIDIQDEQLALNADNVDNDTTPTASNEKSRNTSDRNLTAAGGADDIFDEIFSKPSPLQKPSSQHTKGDHNDHAKRRSASRKAPTKAKEAHKSDAVQSLDLHDFQPVIDPTKIYVRLKFPRLEAVRYDKPWNECMSLQELVALNSATNMDYKEKLGAGDNSAPTKYQPLGLVKRASKQNIDSESLIDMSKGRGRKKRKRSLVSHAKPLKGLASNPNVHIVSSLFEGLEFNIVNGIEGKITKADLERECLERGAKIVQTPGPTTTYVIAGKVNVKVGNYIHSQKYDVVNADWLLQCIKERELFECTPTDYWYISPKTQNKMDLLANTEENNDDSQQFYEGGKNGLKNS